MELYASGYTTITLEECQKIYANTHAWIATVLEARRRWTKFLGDL
jgi:hypothetical protein